jgi:dienelactone hydrolase
MSVVDTHCLPKGTLGTGELPVMQVPSGGNVAIPTGAKRGVVVLLHGISLTVGTPYPLPLVDDAADLMLSFSNDLVNDGWVVVYPGELGDSYLTSQDAGVRADLSADTGNGTRLLANTLHWWDHVVLWIQSNFGNWPFGISWGGWQALQIARNKTSTIIAYGGNVPVSQAWTIDFFGLYDQPPKLSYTLTSGMNNQTLPQATITVNESISSAAASGCLIIVTSSGNQVVNYSGKSGLPSHRIRVGLMFR